MAGDRPDRPRAGYWCRHRSARGVPPGSATERRVATGLAGQHGRSDIRTGTWRDSDGAAGAVRAASDAVDLRDPHGAFRHASPAHCCATGNRAARARRAGGLAASGSRSGPGHACVCGCRSGHGSHLVARWPDPIGGKFATRYRVRAGQSCRGRPGDRLVPDLGRHGLGPRPRRVALINVPDRQRNPGRGNRPVPPQSRVVFDCAVCCRVNHRRGRLWIGVSRCVALGEPAGRAAPAGCASVRRVRGQLRGVQRPGAGGRPAYHPHRTQGHLFWLRRLRGAGRRGDIGLRKAHHTRTWPPSRRRELRARAASKAATFCENHVPALSARIGRVSKSPRKPNRRKR